MPAALTPLPRPDAHAAFPATPPGAASGPAADGTAALAAEPVSTGLAAPARAPRRRHPPRMAPAASPNDERARDGAEPAPDPAADPLFAAQRAGSAELPDPAPLVSNLARSVIEIIAGVRDVEQLARWTTEDAYRTVLTRALHAARARDARRQPPRRPQARELGVRIQEVADGVIEAVVVTDVGARVIPVTMRLEGLDRRWRATHLGVL